MPAIQPARLKRQLAQLATTCYEPMVFVKGLHILLNLYANRTYRSGQSGEPSPLLQSYNVSPPVLKLVGQELKLLVERDPKTILVLCDSLWAEPYLEFRLLAAMLVGQIPLETSEAILERLRNWLEPGIEDRLMEMILDYSMARLRSETPVVVIQMARDWLNNPDPFSQKIGLRALLPLIKSPGFRNLPAIFNLLTPLIRSAPSNMRPDLLRVVEALAHLSPYETAYLLKQQLQGPDNAGLPWLVRKLLPVFPGEIQEGLRASLSNYK